MKKVLVLMLVLGMASMASAGLEIVNNFAADGTVDIISVGTNPNSGYHVIGILAGDGTLSGGIVDPDCPLDDATGIVFDPFAGAGGLPTPLNGVMVGVNDYVLSAPFPAGDYFENFDVTLTANESYVVLFYMPSQTLSEAVELDRVRIIPEPMTMALLGLGGLFLRRRK